MTQTGNAPQSDAVVQRSRYRDWTNSVVARLRAANGWTMEEIAKRGGVSVETIYSWKKKGDEWPDGKPRPETVVKFCDNLGIEPFKAFEILGWQPKTSVEPAPILPQLAQDLARFLLDPNVDSQEKRLVELAVSRLLAPYRFHSPEDEDPAA